MTYRTRAAWFGYPTPAEMARWTVELDVEHPHVVAEGILR